MHKSKLSRRLLACLTVFCMLLGMLPSAAMAADLTYDEDAVGLYVDEDMEITEAVEGLVVVTAPARVTVSNAALSDGIFLTAEAEGAQVTIDGESSVGAVVVLCAADVRVTEKAAVTAVTIAAPATVEVAGKADAVVVIETAAGAAVSVTETATVAAVEIAAPSATATVSGKVESVKVAETAEGAAVTVAETATVSAVEVAAPNATAEVAGSVSTMTVAETAEGAAVTVAGTATVSAIEVAAPNVTTEVSGKVESVTVAETATGAQIIANAGAEISSVTDATGEASVSGDGADSVTVAPAGDGSDSSGSGSTETPSVPSEDPVIPDEPVACVHEYGEGEITTEPTCHTKGEKGVMTYTCTLCGETMTKELDTVDCAEDAGTVTTAATCTNAGVMTYACKWCEAEMRTEAIAATGHSFVDGVCSVCGAADPDNKPAEPATPEVKISGTPTINSANTEKPTMTVKFTLTTVDGVAKVVCTVTQSNGKIFTAKVESDKLTASGETTVQIDLFDAVLTAEGDDDVTGDDGATGGDGTTPTTKVTYTVTVTAYNADEQVISTATTAIDSEGNVHTHEWGEEEVVESTCETAGSKTRTCKTCGAVDKEVSDPLGHSWDEGTVTTEPTCSKKGVKTFTCTRCKVTNTEEIDTTAHTFENGQCKVCGTADPATCEHGTTEDKITKEATCKEAGEKSIVCTACGTVVKTETIEKSTKHTWTTTDGTSTCSVCGTTCNHSGDDDKTDTTCSVCGATVEPEQATDKCCSSCTTNNCECDGTCTSSSPCDNKDNCEKCKETAPTKCACIEDESGTCECASGNCTCGDSCICEPCNGAPAAENCTKVGEEGCKCTADNPCVDDCTVCNPVS